MSFSRNAFLSTLAPFAIFGLLACSSSSDAAPDNTAGGGGTNGGGGTSSAGGSGAGGSGTGFGAVGPCYSTNAACGLSGSSCMTLVDNTTTAKKTLRISQLQVTKPALLASKAIEFSIIGPAVTWTDNAACGLSAPGKAGQFNWLFEFDTAAKTIKTGGAKPVTDPTAGYCYETASFGGLMVAPTTGTVDMTANADGSFDFATNAKFDINVPIFLDSTGTKSPIVLPLKGGSITGGKLTEKGNCIGKFKGDTLDPTTSPPCTPQSGDPTMDAAYSYTNGATLSGYITAEDSDQVIVVDLNTSLCALLSGTGTAGADGVKHCNRDAMGALDFGASKSGPDFKSPSATTVNDAYELGAMFAAAGVKINDSCP